MAKQEGQKKYSVRWSKKALKNLNKIDPTEKDKIIHKVENKLACDPYGRIINTIKPIKGQVRKGQWRYRIGDYRVIYKIFPAEIYICER
jgi:mRNA-degrading endonuclease RelE of RelBE toxin-antitoxin system